MAAAAAAAAVAAGDGGNQNLDARWSRLEAKGQHIGHVMHAMVHADLRNLQRQNYNHKLGLLELYRRAYETSVHEGDVGVQEHERTKGFVSRMQAIAGAAAADLDSHPLITKLRAQIEGGGPGDGDDAPLPWTFARFYPAFLEPFTHDVRTAEQLFSVLDTDGSGEICAVELLSACKWALREFEAERGIESVHALMQIMMSEWAVPEALISLNCTVPDDTGTLRSEPTPTGQPGPGGVLVLTGNTLHAGRRDQGRQEHAGGILRSRVCALRRGAAAAGCCRRRAGGRSGCHRGQDERGYQQCIAPVRGAGRPDVVF